MTLKMDTALVEKPTQSNVNKIERKKQTCSKNAKNKSQHKASDIPKYPCWNCGSMHYAKYCEYIKHEYNDCKRVGYKEGYCTSAHKSKSNKSEKKPDNKYKPTVKSNVVIAVNQIQFQSKRKFITIRINA